MHLTINGDLYEQFANHITLKCIEKPRLQSAICFSFVVKTNKLKQSNIKDVLSDSQKWVSAKCSILRNNQSQI